MSREYKTGATFEGKQYPRPADQAYMYLSEVMARLKAEKYEVLPNELSYGKDILIFANHYGKHAPEGLKCIGSFHAYVEREHTERFFQVNKQDVYRKCVEHGLIKDNGSSKDPFPIEVLSK